MKISDDLHTAYHEVGHWIAALELGVFASNLSIIPDSEEQTSGRVPIAGGHGLLPLPGEDGSSPTFQSACLKHAEDQAIISFSGHAAIVSTLGIGDMGEESAIANGAGMDFGQGKAWLEGDAERINKAKARAIEIITTHQAQIKRIASKLLHLKTLDYEQALQLFYDNWSFWYNDDGTMRE